MGEAQAEFIARYLDGDTQAIAEVDEWIQRAAWSFRRRLADRWEDVQQEIRLEIYRLLKDGRFRGESSLKSYVWRVVNHSCLDEVRSQQRWKWTDLEETAPVHELTDRRSALQAAGRETVDLLLRVLAAVSEECRRLWELILAGHSYREMSRELGSSEGALRVRALRCRKHAVEIRGRLLAGEGANG